MIKKMESKKKRFLKAYIACGYNISEACKKTGVRRDLVLQWKTHDPEFANDMWEVEESITDFVESQMLKQNRNNNPAMIMWFLETKGRTRGYTRKYEMENNVKIELSTEQIDAMVKAHAIATKDEDGRLTIPALQIGDGKDKHETSSEDGDGTIDAEYREAGKGDEGPETDGETSGSEVSGSQ